MTPSPIGASPESLRVSPEEPLEMTNQPRPAEVESVKLTEHPSRVYLEPECCAGVDGPRWSYEPWEECDCRNPQPSPMYVFAGLTPTRDELDAAATTEAQAQAIYEGWKDQLDGWRPWVPGGNSDKQEEARSLARAALQQSTAKTNP